MDTERQKNWQSKIDSRGNRISCMLRDQRKGEGGVGELEGVRLVAGNQEVMEGDVGLRGDGKIQREGGVRTLGQWTGQC